MTHRKEVIRIVHAVTTVEGEGFVVRRPFPTAGLDHVDPFLLLDHMGPVEVAPGEAKGAPDHPHRGFETVTYLLDGAMEHRDSVGNHGRLGPGDVQWMTAGAGVVHSEMPSADLQRDGGRLHGFQLWVNLPRRDKMTAPRYQDVPAATIPVVDRPGVRVRVIAGDALGASGPIDTHSPVLYLHVTIQPGASLEVPVPSGQHALAYVISGVAAFAGADPANEGDLAVFDTAGDAVAVDAPVGAEEPLEVLVLAGEPLNETVARYGPFVMNTRAELVQAAADFQEGRMGRISG
jgi:quercetin 2,3-dioxygenase